MRQERITEMNVRKFHFLLQTERWSSPEETHSAATGHCHAPDNHDNLYYICVSPHPSEIWNPIIFPNKINPRKEKVYIKLNIVPFFLQIKPRRVFLVSSKHLSDHPWQSWYFHINSHEPCHQIIPCILRCVLLFPGAGHQAAGEYWPLIGQYGSRDLNTDLWLVSLLLRPPHCQGHGCLCGLHSLLLKYVSQVVLTIWDNNSRFVT